MEGEICGERAHVTNRMSDYFNKRRVVSENKYATYIHRYSQQTQHKFGDVIAVTKMRITKFNLKFSYLESDRVSSYLTNMLTIRSRVRDRRHRLHAAVMLYLWSARARQPREPIEKIRYTPQNLSQERLVMRGQLIELIKGVSIKTRTSVHTRRSP